MKPSEMTDDQLRIKVMELRGWTGIHNADPNHAHKYVGSLGYVEYRGCLMKGAGNHHKVPDVHHDLDACHEFEFKLFQEDRAAFGRYCETLVCIVRRSSFRSRSEALVLASARQRCEAFVEVMSK